METPKEKEVTRITRQFILNCQKCGQEIIGYSESQCLHNLDVHILSKHKEENKNGK